MNTSNTHRTSPQSRKPSLKSDEPRSYKDQRDHDTLTAETNPEQFLDTSASTCDYESSLDNMEQEDAIPSIQSESAQIEAEIHGRSGRKRLVIAVSLILSLTCLVVGFFGQPVLDNSNANPTQWRTFGVILSIYSLLPAFFYSFFQHRRTTELVTRRAALQARLDYIEKLRQFSYFERLVEINVTNLRDYYAQVKAHADKSFVASLLVGCVGFLLITIGVVHGCVRPVGDATLTYAATGSGILTEFISAIFFYLYNRTVRQMKEYHDSLLNIQNVLLSFKLVDDIPNMQEKASRIDRLLRYLVGSSVQNSDHQQKTTVET